MAMSAQDLQDQMLQRSLNRLRAGAQRQQITQSNTLSDVNYDMVPQQLPDYNPQQDVQSYVADQYKNFNQQYQQAEKQYQLEQAEKQRAAQAVALQKQGYYGSIAPTPGAVRGNVIKDGNYLGLSPMGNLKIPITQGDTPEHSKGEGANAWDYGAPVGTPARATVPGKVIRVQDLGNKSYGKNIWVQGADGHIYIYGHLSAFNVKPGQQVIPGQVLALTGDSGHATGPHLHFEIR